MEDNMSYNKYDYDKYQYEYDYGLTNDVVSGTVTMTMQQFQELQSGFEERVEAIFDRKLKEVFGDD